MNNANKTTTIVIFGASGDLTSRKLLPALFSLFRRQRLPKEFQIVGFARRPYSHDTFRKLMSDALKSSPEFDQASWDSFASHLWYSQGDLNTPEDYDKLHQFLYQTEQKNANRLYYLATSPAYYEPVVNNLKTMKMTSQEDGWRRLIVEKPFGYDLGSAKALNHVIHQ